MQKTNPKVRRVFQGQTHMESCSRFHETRPRTVCVSHRGIPANMNMIEEALTCSHCVISVIGVHANESIEGIFSRKMEDINNVGKTFWLIKSQKARPSQVQTLCQTHRAFALFVTPASKTRPTNTGHIAKEYSENREMWSPIPEGMGDVTGKLDSQAYALVFDKLTTSVDAKLDLWDYADFANPQQPVELMLGRSTICAMRKDMRSHPDKLKSRHRSIVAIARLVTPYCVWVR